MDEIYKKRNIVSRRRLFDVLNEFIVHITDRGRRPFSRGSLVKVVFPF